MGASMATRAITLFSFPTKKVKWYNFILNKIWSSLKNSYVSGISIYSIIRISFMLHLKITPKSIFVMESWGNLLCVQCSKIIYSLFNALRGTAQCFQISGIGKGTWFIWHWWAPASWVGDTLGFPVSYSSSSPSPTCLWKRVNLLWGTSNTGSRGGSPSVPCVGVGHREKHRGEANCQIMIWKVPL